MKHKKVEIEKTDEYNRGYAAGFLNGAKLMGEVFVCMIKYDLISFKKIKSKRKEKKK